MAEDSTVTASIGVGGDPAAPSVEELPKTDSGTPAPDCKNENGVILDGSKTDDIKIFAENCDVMDNARSLEDLDSLPAGDELALALAASAGVGAGSDSGVEGCGGRALSSGGGSRSCASSVVSCGSGCGSESSSVAGAPPRPRRRTVTVAEPAKRGSPVASTPRPATAPRGPNLATRERARSREKPALPEKPRPLTPKPRIRPAADLPSLVRESPALRAKPTKTSAARCRTPNSPSEEKRWPATAPRLACVPDAGAARLCNDKYATLPRRRRENDPDTSPKHEVTPPSSRRPTVTRSISTRSTTKTRVRIYAEKTSQTVLLGTDVESALAGIMPNIESRIDVSKCSRGVQANSRDNDIARLSAAVAKAEAALEEERERRLRAEAQLAEERAGRQAAHDELERNSHRLLELAGAGAGANAEGCLRALEEQLKAAGELANRQRGEIDSLRSLCDTLHAEACSGRESTRILEVRLREAEREASEMQDFLAAETGALSDSLREAEAELARANHDLEKRRVECRQLVRMCEQRRQESLAAAARARAACGAGAGGGGAGAGTGAALSALGGLAARLAALTDHVRAATHYDVYSRSDSGEAATPEERLERGLRGAGGGQGWGGGQGGGGSQGGLLAAVTRALAAHIEDKSHASDDNDNSADLLDSETEPCLVTDPDYAEEWWSGAEGTGAWSGSELSPVRDEPPGQPGHAPGLPGHAPGLPGHAPGLPGQPGQDESLSERDSLRNLSAAIQNRHRSEQEDAERGTLLDKVLVVEYRLTELLRALRHAAAAELQHTDDTNSVRLADALRDKLDITEKNVADQVVKKLAELDVSRNMMGQYRQSVEMLQKQLAQPGEENLELLEEELMSCNEIERRERYEALDAALTALSSRQRTVCSWGRLASLHSALEQLAFVLAAAPCLQPPPNHQTLQTSA